MTEKNNTLKILEKVTGRIGWLGIHKKLGKLYNAFRLYHQRNLERVQCIP